MGVEDKILMLSMLESLFKAELIDINTYTKSRGEIEKL